MMYDVIIIGAGASGLACANALLLEDKNIRLLVLEQLDVAGKKILATGNGRCNVSNIDLDKRFYNHEEIHHIIKDYGLEQTKTFFHSLGIITKEEQGRIYPFTNQAKTIQRSLIQNLIHTNTLQLNTTVESIIYQQHYQIKTNQGNYQAKHIVMATGGKAGLTPDSDPYTLVRALNFNLTKMHPGITQVRLKDDMNGLKGVRMICEVKLVKNKQVLLTDLGELQLTNEGLSGIPIFQLSRLIDGDDYYIYVDFMPSIDYETFVDIIYHQCQLYPNESIKNLGVGTLNELFVAWLLKNRYPRLKKLSDLKESDIHSMVALLKNYKFSVKEVFDFQFAQVTVGGVDLSQINTQTLETTSYPNMFMTGELLDVDGACGGYNLQWAWASGQHVAKQLIKRIKAL